MSPYQQENVQTLADLGSAWSQESNRVLFLFCDYCHLPHHLHYLADQSDWQGFVVL